MRAADSDGVGSALPPRPRLEGAAAGVNSVLSVQVPVSLAAISVGVGPWAGRRAPSTAMRTTPLIKSVFHFVVAQLNFMRQSSNRSVKEF
jgi:hypothetical protein